TGRVILRQPGTEPVGRVMVEAADKDTAQQQAQYLADVVSENLQLRHIENLTSLWRQTDKTTVTSNETSTTFIEKQTFSQAMTHKVFRLTHRSIFDYVVLSSLRR